MIPVLRGLVPIKPVLLICCRVLLVHALSDIAPAKIYFTEGIIRTCGDSIIEFVVGGKIETSLMVRQLNKFC